MPINCKYNRYLSKIFSGPSIQKLATEGRCDFISSVVKSSGILDELRPVTTWECFFEKTYCYLFNNYRNEYVYKNAIANKILLGRHSLNTSNLLTEFRVGKSKADIVILNGTSSVYEIKSEFDSFDRLEEQIRSYRKVFGFINVITHKSQLRKLEKLVPDDVGIILLTNRYTFRTLRKPISNRYNVDQSTIFDCLRKNEYLKIIKKEFNSSPKVPNTRLHSVSKQLFCKLKPRVAHDCMVEVLRNRMNNQSKKEFIINIPKSLKVAGLSTNLSKSQRASFSALLPSKFNLS